MPTPQILENIDQISRLHFLSIPSTNDWIKANYQKYIAQLPLLLTADEMTAPRGQAGNSWYFEKSRSIGATLVFKVSQKFRTNPVLVNMLFTSTLANVIANLIHEPVEVKWPNDLLIRNYKFSGILMEKLDEDTYAAGVGINVRNEYIPDVTYAASLMQITGKLFLVDELLENIFLRLSATKFWESTAVAEEIRNQFQSQLWRLNQPVKVFTKQLRVKDAVFHGVDMHGRAVIELDNEEEKQAFHHGEIKISYNFS